MALTLRRWPTDRLGAFAASLALACFAARDVWWWLARDRIARAQTFGGITADIAQLRSASVVLLVIGLLAAAFAAVRVWRRWRHGDVPMLASTQRLASRRHARWWVATGAAAFCYLAVRTISPLFGADGGGSAFLVAESDRPRAADVAAALSGLESWPFTPLGVLGLGLVVVWWRCHLRLLILSEMSPSGR